MELLVYERTAPGWSAHVPAVPAEGLPIPDSNSVEVQAIVSERSARIAGA